MVTRLRDALERDIGRPTDLLCSLLQATSREASLISIDDPDGLM